MRELRPWLNIAGAGIVLILLIFLRFYQLGQIPQGINVDEASYGYDAYSLLKTQKDMWGEKSMSLKSFGDYKPAGLSYTLAPFIHYLDLNTFTTRLPSAIFGSLTLIVTFYLIRYLLQSTRLALLATLILGLSPWHFGLSRLFYEPNVGLFFIVCSLFLEFAYIRNPTKTKYLLLSAICVGIAGYYYSVLRYLGIGVLGISLILAQFPHYRKIFKYGVLMLVCWAVVAVPYLGDMVGEKGVIRLKQEGRLHEFGNVLVITENREMCYISSGYNPTIAKLCYGLWNKPGEVLTNAAKVYVQLLSPKYLFLNGYQKDVIPESSGAFLEILIPFYLAGIFYLVTHAKKKKELRFILFAWLFVTIPIAVAGALNIHRNVVGLYFVFLICLYGIFYTHELIKKIPHKLLRYLLLCIIILAYLWSQSRFVANYFFVFTRMQPEIWLYDTPEIMHYLGTNKNQREINYYGYDFGPLLYSFYNRLDPVYFQKNAVWNEPNEYGWTHINKVNGVMKVQENPWSTICLHKDALSPSQIILITGDRADWQSAVEKQFRNFTGIHVLHELYDSQTLYAYLLKKDPKNLNAQCAQLKK